MDRLNEHCDNNGLIPDYQSAYRKFFSCETSVLKLVNYILWGMECQEISSMIACNLSASFDTVDHSLLLDVLSNKFRVGGTALNWFDSYLHPRSLKVMIGKELSRERNLPFSVPQGSCAGAQLFNLYCSTLHEVVISTEEDEKPLSLYGFADDHTVCDQFKANYRSAELESITKLQQCASSLKSWMDLNRLRMNNAKTEFILYGSQLQLDKCIMDEILIVDLIIKRSETVQQLGVFLDKNLNFKHHITTKCKNAMKSILKIKNIRKYLTQSAAEILVLSTVVSHLDYCNSILAGLPNSEISQM